LEVHANETDILVSWGETNIPWREKIFPMQFVFLSFLDGLCIFMRQVFRVKVQVKTDLGNFDFTKLNGMRNADS
jgi:hypothetical protein